MKHVGNIFEEENYRGRSRTGVSGVTITVILLSVLSILVKWLISFFISKRLQPESLFVW